MAKLKARRLVDGDIGEPGGYGYFLRTPRGPLRSGNAFVVGDAAGLATRDLCEGIDVYSLPGTWLGSLLDRSFAGAPYGAGERAAELALP